MKMAVNFITLDQLNRDIIIRNIKVILTINSEDETVLSLKFSCFEINSLFNIVVYSFHSYFLNRICSKTFKSFINETVYIFNQFIYCVNSYMIIII